MRNLENFIDMGEAFYFIWKRHIGALDFLIIEKNIGNIKKLREVGKTPLQFFITITQFAKNLYLDNMLSLKYCVVGL